MRTHYAHVLATVGAGTAFDPDLHPVSLDGFPCLYRDITDTPTEDYLTAPGQVVVHVEADEATLDAIAAAPGNVELFRDELPQEGV